MRVAALDCGTNSLRMLVADTLLENDELTLIEIERSMEVVRLGQGVDATGEFAQEALARTFAETDRIAARLAQLRPERTVFVATSASRDVANRAEFEEGIRERLGVTPQVISGEREAELSFRGAVSGMDAGPREKLLVVDLGGGSTECVLGDRHGVIASDSADMGAVRFTERFFHSDPPSAEEIAGAERAAQQMLDDVAQRVDFSRVERVVGVAGTVTTVTAHALDLPAYDSQRIDGAILPLHIVEAACSEILSLPRQRLAELEYIHPGRVDVIQAGALIWRTLLRYVAEATHGRVRSVATSEHDILDGIALEAGEIRP